MIHTMCMLCCVPNVLARLLGTHCMWYTLYVVHMVHIVLGTHCMWYTLYLVHIVLGTHCMWWYTLYLVHIVCARLTVVAVGLIRRSMCMIHTIEYVVLCA